MLSFEINSNLCEKHNTEFCLYCKDENELICTQCYETCRINDHEILGLNEYSNEISETLTIIFNQIKNDKNQNNVTIERLLKYKNKLKQKIQQTAKNIQNDSDLLIKIIQNSKINSYNLLKKMEIITNIRIGKLLNQELKKQKTINKNQMKINNLIQLRNDNNHINFIKESKEIINRGIPRVRSGYWKGGQEEGHKYKEKVKDKYKDKEEKRKGGEKDERVITEDEFDPRMKENLIELKNGNKTAWNPYKRDFTGLVCGKKIYSRGGYEIKIKIDQFPNSNNQWNEIWLGVIKTENRKKLIKNDNWNLEGTYYFITCWDEDEKCLVSQKIKREGGKYINKSFPEEISLKKNDVFSIFLDMEQKKMSFNINEKKLGGWEKLPEKVNFFAYLAYQTGEEKNQITIN
ncbi:hypothetical protein M0813_04998 [Anaeramoeba flamelloides]|uniref:B box-type domain-containing protein n=1 Tax=Anaeramoeba flamelloides TaxID=1746091 RepID=A0ABQ8XK50_9EUKA|nr:hypothetical protein M0813_04998 [Anaeramoeba flamelloides]